MTGESLAIIVVILVLSFVCLRAGKRFFAVLVLPLTAVPVGYLVGRTLTGAVSARMSPSTAVIFFTLLGLAVGAALCLLLSKPIPSRRGKSVYLVCAILFSVLLCFAYIIRLTT